MVPYFVAFVLLGLPIAWVEWTIGRCDGIRGHNSASGIFRAVTGRNSMAYAGSICATLTTIITAYYLFIESWCLAYCEYSNDSDQSNSSRSDGLAQK